MFGRKTVSSWSSDTPLIQFPPLDDWTIGDSFEGTQIFGSLGSGKTSGSGCLLALKMLQAGYGGLVMTSKPDETERWMKMAEETKRHRDVVLFLNKTQPRTFNFLAYHLYHNPDVASSDLASILVSAARVNSDNKKFEAYWEARMLLLTEKLIDLARAGNSLTIGTLRDILSVVPRKPDDLKKGTPWADLMEQIIKQSGNTREVQSARWHLEDRLLSVPDKQREGFVDPFFTVLSAFETGHVQQVYDPDPKAVQFDPQLAPTECFKKGTIVILDLPTTVNLKNGRLAQVIYKQSWQMVLKGRKAASDSDRPVFLWADESQEFVIPADAKFQQFARSARVATVYLTQNIPNYNAAMSPDETMSLVGNLQTKFFHANGDSETNRYAVDLIGETTDNRMYGGTKEDENGLTRPTEMKYDREDKGAAARAMKSGDFTVLRTGNKRSDGKIDAILFQAGRRWKGHGMRNWMDAVFTRRY